MPSSTRITRPGWRSPRRASSRAIGPPANALTPYEPRVAARTMSAMARPVTRDRPGVGRMATRAGSSLRERGRALLERWSGVDRLGRSGRERVLSYRPARAEPARALHLTPSFEDTHGPLLRDLRQGFDGRFQPA